MLTTKLKKRLFFYAHRILANYKTVQLKVEDLGPYLVSALNFTIKFTNP